MTRTEDAMNTNMSDERTFWDVVPKLAMIGAAIILYFKTAQVMTAFAPSVVFGYTGLEVLFGNLNATLVEGIILALHFIPSMQRNEAAKVFKWFLFGISALCQVVDGFLVQNTLAQQPESIQFIVSWGVPLIPTIIFFGLLTIGQSAGSVGKRKAPFKGIKHYLPDWKTLWDGDGSVGNSESIALAKDVEQEELEQSVGKSPNPTRGKVKKP
jgi:hypothetical protein